MTSATACQGCGAAIAPGAAQRDSAGRSVCTTCQSKDLSDLSDAMAFGDEMEMMRVAERQRTIKLVRLAVGIVFLLIAVGSLASMR